ncbi:MAG: CPBP family intramembrane metalloprotease [Pseudomonadales bacterium]|nr:CPBP family intramembrane metalloprotease [Pseudomonadales bacterium]
MHERSDTIINLVTFTTLTILFYIAGYWLIYRLGQATPLMLSVGAATLLTCVVRGRKVSDLGWHWGAWPVHQVSYLLPLGITLVSYLFIWVLGLGDFYNQSFVSQLKADYNLPHWNDLFITVFHILQIATIGFFISLPSVLGEEIGWRGFLVPELAKLMPFTGVALVSGFSWALFHWPLIILGLYGNDIVPLSYQLLVFSVFITASGVILAYFRMITGSLWPAVVYHASSNIYIQKLFTPLTGENEVSAWYIDEFGAVTAGVASCVAFYYWQKGSRAFNNSTKSSLVNQTS